MKRASDMLIRLSGEQNHHCAYCGERMRLLGFDRRKPDARKQSLGKATIDHVIPKSMGGTDDWHNLVAACRCCNHYRNNQPAEIAFVRIRRLVERGTHPMVRQRIHGHPGPQMLCPLPPIKVERRPKPEPDMELWI